MRSGLRRGEWEKGGNWLAIAADVDGDVKEKKGREMRDERQGRIKRRRTAMGSARIGEVSVRVREEYQRVMV